MESQGLEFEVHLLGVVGELGICSEAESLPSMYRALEHSLQHQHPAKRLALCSGITVSREACGGMDESFPWDSRFLPDVQRILMDSRTSGS